ncbi:MAG: histidinol-phosphate transaminase [Candidatus Omnitrophota bacterium]
MVKIKERIKKLNRFPRVNESRVGYIRSDKNENISSWNKEVLAGIFNSIKPEEFSMYPEPFRLYGKLAKYLGVKEDRILLTNGSDGGIKSAFEVFVEPGDQVAVLDPTYAMYDVYCRIFGAKKLSIGFKSDFSLDKKKLIASISKKTRLIALANPNSPTGTVIEPDFLLEVIQRAGRIGTAVLIDEAYFHFYPGTVLKEVKNFNNLIVLRTFSKALGAASIRLGYAVACPDIIEAFFKVRPMYEAHTFALKAAEYIIDHPERIRDYVRRESQGKKYITEGLRKIGLEVFPGEANFVLIKANGKRKEIYSYLKSRGVLAYLPFANTFLKDYFRITTGPKEKMEIVLRRLKGYFKR